MTPPQSSERQWPARPYKGFGNYGPEDVALFAGRDDEIAEFARLVARSEVRLVLLHGPTGCGKSSFLRAGVIPFLEGRHAGFAFLKNPNDPAIHPAATDATAVFVRSTANPLETLAGAVFRLAERGYEFLSPAGPERLTFTEAKRGCTSADEFVSRVTRAPLELIPTLESLAAELPLKLVLVVDQAEEVLTLRRRRHTDDHAERFFTFLDAFAETRWPLSLIVSLRTEFYGVFQTRLRRRSRAGETHVHDYFLDELSRADIVEAILRPTLTTSVAGFGAPRDVYRFAFEEGVPERIADNLAEAADVDGLVSGSLPFLQVVCESVYKSTKLRKGSEAPWLITRDDYRPGGVLELMAQFVDDMLDAFLRPRSGAVDLARSHWKDVLASLAKTQADGSTTTEIKRFDELRDLAIRFGASDVGDMLAYLASDEQSVLRRDRIAEPSSPEPIEFYSLRHDAIGLVLRLWSAKRETYQQQLVFKDVIRQFMPSVEEIELACAFDESGSGQHVRRWLDVRSQQTVVDYRIPYGFAVSAPGRIAVPPDGIVAAITQPTPSVLAVRFIESQLRPESLRGDIEICGRLEAATGFVGFEIRQLFERAFYMRRSEVEEAYKSEEWTTEYTGIFVQLPTGRLRLSVRFPAAFASPRLEAGPVVFLGSGEKTHEAEIARIRPNFRLMDTVATLDVTEPLQGLQYGIYWMPPG